MNTLDYIHISQHLSTAFPQIKTIDLFNSQYLMENPKKEHAVNYPAVYIEFASTSWEDMTRGLKKGSSIIRIHVVVNSLRDTANIHRMSPEARAIALEHYTLANQIASKLEGFTPTTGLTALSKSDEQNDTNHDQVIAEIFSYSYDRIDADSSALKTQLDKIITDFILTGELAPLRLP